METVTELKREASECVFVFTMCFPMRYGWHPDRRHCTSMNFVLTATSRRDALRHKTQKRLDTLWLAHSGSPAVLGPKPFRPLTLRRTLSCALPFSDEFLLLCSVDPFDAVREHTKTSFLNIFGSPR